MNNQQLQNFCNNNNYNLIRIINKNERKDTFIVLVQDPLNTSKFILKVHGEDAPNSVMSSFQKEISFYKQHSNNSIPKLIKFEKNYFVLEYFDGNSLPEVINQQFFQAKHLSSFNTLQIFSLLYWFHNLENGLHSSNQSEKKLIMDSFLDRIGNLITSGPKETKRSYLESFILRRIYNKYFFKLQQNLEKMANNWIKNDCKILSKYGHNDLHCNNILSDDSFSEFKLIDFEKIGSPGIWVSDTAYFTATLYALFSSKPQIQEKIKNDACTYICKLEPKFNSSDVFRLLDVFCLAGEINSRFRLQNKGIKFNKMLEFISSIKNL